MWDFVRAALGNYYTSAPPPQKSFPRTNFISSPGCVLQGETQSGESPPCPCPLPCLGHPAGCPPPGQTPPPTLPKHRIGCHLQLPPMRFAKPTPASASGPHSCPALPWHKSKYLGSSPASCPWPLYLHAPFPVCAISSTHRLMLPHPLKTEPPRTAHPLKPPRQWHSLMPSHGCPQPSPSAWLPPHPQSQVGAWPTAGPKNRWMDQ